MTFKERPFTPYELKIVESLISEYGSEEKAIQIVTEYREPVHELGGYYGPEDLAESLIKIVKKGIRPEQWLAHMKHLNQYVPSNSFDQRKQADMAVEQKLVSFERAIPVVKTGIKGIPMEAVPSDSQIRLYSASE